jgi:translation initiation factor 1
MAKGQGAKESRLVWSSAVGRVCPECGQGVAACSCRRKAAPDQGDGIVRVRRETKGRGGKTVTVVSGVPGDEAAIRALAGELKRRCGSGGTLKDGVMEIQGDHSDLLVAELSSRGYRAKRSGG